jgi:hypothetical protein
MIAQFMPPHIATVHAPPAQKRSLSVAANVPSTRWGGRGEGFLGQLAALPWSYFRVRLVPGVRRSPPLSLQNTTGEHGASEKSWNLPECVRGDQKRNQVVTNTPVRRMALWRGRGGPPKKTDGTHPLASSRRQAYDRFLKLLVA